MEKRRPHHDLARIKVAFSSKDRLNRTVTAMRGAEALSMDEQGVVDIVSGLAPRDFEKSMTSLTDARNWQDVYRPTVDGRALYVKFTLDAQGQYLLISFKESET